jgi:Na+-driven multidrug efflux pump
VTVAREVRRLALPAIATSLLQTAVFLVDRVMLGRHSAVDLAAIHIAGNVEWSIFSVSTAFTVGTLALVGMATGGRDPRAARAATVVSLGIAAALGVATALVLVPALALLPSAFPHASAQVAAGATGYLRASFLVAPAMLAGAAATAALQGSGDTRTPLLVGIVVMLMFHFLYLTS